MWECWSLMWTLCNFQIILIKKYSFTKYCRYAQRNPNKNVHLKKVLPPPQRNGLVPSSCHALRLDATTLLYKRVYFIKGTVVQWMKIFGVIDCKSHILLEKVTLLGPKLTGPHQSVQCDIVKPIEQYFNQSLIGCNLEADQHLKEALSYQHQCKITTLPLERHLSSTSSSLSMPSCEISL